MYVSYCMMFKYIILIRKQEINTLFSINQLEIEKKIQRLFH
jgi:hypothetical protein